MKLIFKGKNKGYDVWVKSMIFHLADGPYIKVNRTITEYTVDDGVLNMTWTGCYVEREDKRKSDYSINPAMFKGAEIVDISLRDDAPEGYELLITEWRAEN